METNGDTSLLVSLKELSPMHVAFIDYIANSVLGDMHQEIGECFQRLQSWVDKLGLDHHTLLHVGIPSLGNVRLITYECCVEVPANIQTGLENIGIKELPGGLYAIVMIKKESEIIGKSIEHFYQEYVPNHGLHIDDARPTYEIYYEDTMEYCVPIQDTLV